MCRSLRGRQRSRPPPNLVPPDESSPGSHEIGAGGARPSGVTPPWGMQIVRSRGAVLAWSRSARDWRRARICQRELDQLARPEPDRSPTHGVARAATVVSAPGPAFELLEAKRRPPGSGTVSRGMLVSRVEASRAMFDLRAVRRPRLGHDNATRPVGHPVAAIQLHPIGVMTFARRCGSVNTSESKAASRGSVPDDTARRRSILRSRRSVVLLAISAVAGLVVSFAAWGFRELVHQI